MDPKREMLIRDAISEVLEAMFFVSVGFSEPAHVSASSLFCCSSVQMCRGSETMEIGIAVTESFGRMIAANFLGIREEGVKSEELEDVLKELVNMAGGNYLDRADSENWQLEIPRFRRFAQSSSATLWGMPMDVLGEPAGLVFIESGSFCSQSS